MTGISASLVKELRDATGIAMMKCKQALVEAGGDLEKAREILRKQGEKDAAKKSERTTGEGRVVTKISADKKKGALVQILCETDFVAKGDDFIQLVEKIGEIALENGAENIQAETENLIQEGVQKIGENIQLSKVEILEGKTVANYIHSNNKIGVLVALLEGSEEIGKDIAMQVAAMNPSYLNPEDVPIEDVEKEKKIASEELAKEGKPAEIIDKILEGKLRKFRDNQSLVKQAFVKDSSKTVEQFLQENGVKVEKFVRVAI